MQTDSLLILTDVHRRSGVNRCSSLLDSNFMSEATNSLSQPLPPICARRCISPSSGTSGARKPSPPRSARTSPSCSTSARYGATGATSWIASPTRAPKPRRSSIGEFIAVKVDRDERPDVDSRYQLAVSAISGTGGWPLTVFLTPDGRPFYGGTYFPPDRPVGPSQLQEDPAGHCRRLSRPPRRGTEVGRRSDERAGQRGELLPAARPSFRRDWSASWCSRRCPSSTRRTAASAARRNFRIPPRSIC